LRSTVPDRGAGFSHRADTSGVDLPMVPPLSAHCRDRDVRWQQRWPGRHVIDIRARRGCQQTQQQQPKASSPEWTWRQRRWTNAASSRRAESVAASGPAGLSRPARRISIPEIRTAPLGSEIPATEITAPTRSRILRQRVRTVLARRATPTTVSSAPTRSRQRSRLIRAGRLLRGVDLSTQPPEDVRTTIRRCDRSLIAASNTHARRVPPEGENCLLPQPPCRSRMPEKRRLSARNAVRRTARSATMGRAVIAPSTSSTSATGRATVINRWP